jgi:hypothetical protein
VKVIIKNTLNTRKSEAWFDCKDNNYLTNKFRNVPGLSIDIL